jgi:hypothetical protein
VGNFYTNVTLRGPEQARVLVAVKALGYRAFVAATGTELTVICEEQSDTQDNAIWLEVAKRFSEKLNCPALAVMNHDDDILSYALYRNGTLLDEYNSCPDYWGNADTPVPPRGGDAQTLCEVFGMPGNAVEVERILRTTTDCNDEGADVEEEFVFAWERHAALVKALDWPDIPYQQGFDYLTKDGAPPDWCVIL